MQSVDEFQMLEFGLRDVHHDELGKDFAEFVHLTEIYGAKVAGLLALPRAWCPPFTALPTSYHSSWTRNFDLDLSDAANQLSDWLNHNRLAAKDGFIVRSSGVRERFGDRGQFLSIPLPSDVDCTAVKDAIILIFQHALIADPDEQMGILVQVYLRPDVSGHLSNTVRLSPTRNQWKYETEKPDWAPTKGLNSKFAPLPDPKEPFRCASAVPHQSLRSLGQWINCTVSPRSHVEWVVNSGCLWAVQLDLEWDEQDTGLDPASLEIENHRAVPDSTAAKVFQPYTIGTPTVWRKLRNLNEFDFQSQTEQPILYFATAQDIRSEFNMQHHSELITEINSLTAARGVLRTDLSSDHSKNFNLPRTDTVDGERAIQWITEQCSAFEDDRVNLADVAFLLHAFLPARSSAWVYARPGEPIAFVDALWGLPDGLQVLPHDSYEIDTTRSHLIAERIRFKPRFLCERADGTWRYEDISRKRGRSRVLSKIDAVELGVRTSRIASKLGEDAQIMWLCGIPTHYRVGRNLPWYRAREFAEQAPRHESRYPPVDIANERDLEKLSDRSATIRLNPEAELIRDDKFLGKVIEIALGRRLPVELQGSLLSHTYYRLSSAGVAVVLAESAKYFRKRGRQTFGKIVRDKIPTGIKEGGERVSEGKLAIADVKPGLVAKLFEEAEELLNAENRPDHIEELTDLLDVIRGLAASLDITWEDVEKSAQAKVEKRGGFFDRKVLLETSLPMRKPVNQETNEVQLREISHIKLRKNNAHVPFTLLLSGHGAASFEIEIEEKRYQINARIMNGGIHLTFSVSSRDESEQRQLDMFPA